MTSLTVGQKVDKCCQTGCCLNGGVCFPSSDFCQCPRQFYGYRCEKRRMRLCGFVKHLQWARIGCNLCRCFDSHLLCMSHIYSGCDGKPPKEEVDLNDYKDDISIFPMNEASSSAIDNDYSSSNTDRDMKGSNSSDSTGSNDSMGSSDSKTSSETLSSRSAYSDFYYYNYDDEDEENNDNISNKSNPFSNIRTLTFRGYFWICLVCLTTSFMNWIMDFNTDIYFVS
ncbi:hypothetical protein BsWGS_02312 [Bradybaena similaris]